MLLNAILIIVILLSPYVQFPALARDSVDNATIEAVIARQRALSNLVVEYEQSTSLTPKLGDHGAATPDARRAPAREIVTQGKATSKRSFRYLDGQLRYDSHIVSANGTVERLPIRRIGSLSRERVETLWRLPDEAWDHGIIDVTGPVPDDIIFDCMLGLRGYNDPDLIVENDWRQTQTRDSGKLIDIERREDGRPEVGSPIVHIWVADPEKGYAFVQYRVVYEGKVSVAGTSSDFRQVDDIFLPYAITWATYGPGGPDAGAVSATEIRVSNYQVNSRGNTSDQFLLEWPKNTIVSDRRNGNVIHVKDGPRILDDAYLQSLARGETALLREQRTSAMRGFFVAQLAAVVVIISLLWIRRHRKRQCLDREDSQPSER